MLNALSSKKNMSDACSSKKNVLDTCNSKKNVLDACNSKKMLDARKKLQEKMCRINATPEERNWELLILPEYKILLLI